MWALTEPGIMIQNLDTNAFLELNEVQERIWSYIDGTHTEEEILSRLQQEFIQESPGDLELLLKKTISNLAQFELIIDKKAI